MESSRLSLKDYLSHYIAVDKLTTAQQELMTFENYKNLISSILMLTKRLNINSSDELKLFDNFRYNLLSKANDYLSINDKNKAKELMDILDNFADENKYPYQDENGKKYADYIRQRI